MTYRATLAVGPRTVKGIVNSLIVITEATAVRCEASRVAVDTGGSGGHLVRGLSRT